MGPCNYLLLLHCQGLQRSGCLSQELLQGSGYGPSSVTFRKGLGKSQRSGLGSWGGLMGPKHGGREGAGGDAVDMATREL